MACPWRWRSTGMRRSGFELRMCKLGCVKCSVDACDKAVVARGWCRTHYMRWKRHGDVNTVKRQSGRVCSIEGCGKPHQSRGWCWTHYERWRTHGDPLFEAEHSQWLGDAVGYAGAHERLRREQGPASSRDCVDCGAPAEHWSLKRDYRGDLKKNDQDQIWTLDWDDYEPRCVPCHREYDKTWGGRKGRPPVSLST
jgi:hypothetical protein